MKKVLCTLLFLAALTVNVFAQAPVNVFDPFYEDVSLWEGIGLINDAPSVRPFPLQEIKRLLLLVIGNGDSGQRRRAEEYYNRFFGRTFHFGGLAELAITVPKKQRELNLSPFMDLNYALHELFTISGRVSAFLTNKRFSQALMPEFQYSKYDIADDAVSVGPLYVLPLFNTGVAIGTARYYVSAGISRTSYGPFHENSPFVGSQAIHQGQFAFVLNREKWTYNQAFLALTATNDLKDNRRPGKFMMIHSLTVRPLPWISFAIVDTMIYGKRFEPIYLLPLSAFFVSQGLYDFPDNSLIGGSFTIKPIRGLRLDGALYSDDIGFNEIVKFKKDAKWRMSGQFGITYTMPSTHWFSFADLNYTVVFPYTYTHYDNYDTKAPNYQNYTHNGIPLGSNLDPNSDRLQLRLKFRPLYGLDINFSETFIRHANTTESADDIIQLKDFISKHYTTDGSTFNYSTVTELDENNQSASKKNAFLYSTPFMKQQTIQYVNQLALDVSCHLPILKSGGYMLFKLGYVFEANINPGVRQNIYKPVPELKGWDKRLIKDMSDEEIQKIKDIAADQLAQWRADARSTQFNHYIRLSAEVAY